MRTKNGLDIIAAHNEFSLARTYQDRLVLFDSYFNLLPLSLASFDEKLSFLRFEQEIEQLCKIHRDENQRTIELRKVFTICKTEYVFDIAPINSLPPVFNSFIIGKFIREGLQSGVITDIIEIQHHDTVLTAITLMKESDSILEELREFLQLKKRKHFRAQLITVFLSGYEDAISGIEKKFRYRKKIIELYLYAQGILYFQYRQKLQQFSLSQFEPSSYTMQDIATKWTIQIQLLHKMGILDLLKEKIKVTPGTTSFKFYRKIVCRIIGQSSLMDDTIGDYLSQFEKGN